MRISFVVSASFLLVAGLGVSATNALAEPVGKAVYINTSVSGDEAELANYDPVNRDEKIRTNGTGLGQFLFDDGTKLAVGPNSSIVIDKYVLGEGNHVTALALNTAKGAFRWISGTSPSSSYKILTPFGTLGVRGTAVDGYVGNGIAMFVLLRGGITFCKDTRCVDVKRPCDFVVASADGNISAPDQLTTKAVRKYGKSTVPFLINNATLLPSMRFARNYCNVATGLSTGSGSFYDPNPEPRARGGGRGQPSPDGPGNTP